MPPVHAALPVRENPPPQHDFRELRTSRRDHRFVKTHPRSTVFANSQGAPPHRSASNAPRPRGRPPPVFTNSPHKTAHQFAKTLVGDGVFARTGARLASWPAGVWCGVRENALMTAGRRIELAWRGEGVCGGDAIGEVLSKSEGGRQSRDADCGFSDRALPCRRLVLVGPEGEGRRHAESTVQVQAWKAAEGKGKGGWRHTEADVPPGPSGGEDDPFNIAPGDVWATVRDAWSMRGWRIWRAGGRRALT